MAGERIVERPSHLLIYKMKVTIYTSIPVKFLVARADVLKYFTNSCCVLKFMSIYSDSAICFLRGMIRATSWREICTGE